MVSYRPWPPNWTVILFCSTVCQIKPGIRSSVATRKCLCAETEPTKLTIISLLTCSPHINIPAICCPFYCVYGQKYYAASSGTQWECMYFCRCVTACGFVFCCCARMADCYVQWDFFFFTACWLPVYLYIWFNVGVAQDDQGVPWLCCHVCLFVCFCRCL